MIMQMHRNIRAGARMLYGSHESVSVFHEVVLAVLAESLDIRWDQWRNRVHQSFNSCVWVEWFMGQQ